MGSSSAIRMATMLMIVAFVAVLSLLVIGPAFEQVETGESAGADVDLVETAEEAVEELGEIAVEAEEIIEEATDELLDNMGNVIPKDVQAGIQDIIKGNNEGEVMTQ